MTFVPETWGVYEKDGVRHPTHVMHQSEHFYCCCTGTFDRRTNTHVLDKGKRMIYVGLRMPDDDLPLVTPNL